MGGFISSFKAHAEIRCFCFVLFSIAVLSFLGFTVRPLGLLSIAVYVGWIVVSSILCRIIASGAKCNYQRDLSGKVCIITGANTGVGKTTALRLIRLGARVILTCRNTQKGEMAANDLVEILKEEQKDPKEELIRSRLKVAQLDLRIFESIEKFAKQVIEEEKTVDILINNAGVSLTPFELVKPCEEAVVGIENNFLSNHLGHFLLTNLLLEKIKSSPGNPRIINVTSSVFKDAREISYKKISNEATYHKNEAYKASKMCNVLFTAELQRRLNSGVDSRVTVYAAHPGVVATEIGRHVADVKLLQRLRPLLLLMMKTPEEGCETSVHCAIHPKAVPGGYHSECCHPEDFSSRHQTSTQMAEELWIMSEEIIAACKQGRQWKDQLLS
jgi:NAD(P)-dependent dehydrogenase (short-subunit alcohol dehydrogenase family)